MVVFFRGVAKQVFAVNVIRELDPADVQKLVWLFGGASLVAGNRLDGLFIGPRREMITPWSTNAVEITFNMGINSITRVEEFFEAGSVDAVFDPMLQKLYEGLGQDLFDVGSKRAEVLAVKDIAAYNAEEGLALSSDEVEYLCSVSRVLGRDLTDSEVFGFSQVNSEHCRHKIFNGIFVIDGVKKEKSLFQLIKETSIQNPNLIVSAYKDNVAFIKGPAALQFSPRAHDRPEYFREKRIDTVISLKAETHNFPTTVEPFNGAATGTGGEIRDRLAGGKGSLPLAGTAVYMTSYPRLEGGREWERNLPARTWLYQSPRQILIKASNGASDFGNKFGQPLICGSVLTFECFKDKGIVAYDKVIMLAGGIGFANTRDSKKGQPAPGDKVVVIGGDNYRIGMGGGAVSSVATGEYDNAIELNAVQRSNPEMQKRAMNAIRAMAESDENPVVSIHDHGAGGHLNCLSELVESTGGTIFMDKLPIGDPTLSAREIIGNESQERMGLVMKPGDIGLLERVASRERAPIYIVGLTTGDMHLKFVDEKGNAPIDLKLTDMFASPPKIIMNDESVQDSLIGLKYDSNRLRDYIELVLQLEAVACKDWLTNKVDRSVTGRVAKQQCAGEIQLPLNNLGVAAIDYTGSKGVATSIGHAPGAALIDPVAGSVLSVAEALTNLVWAPLEHGLNGVSLSANWMWPCRNPGEDARLYKAVEGLSHFAIALGINVPTGKDSLSMTQKYKNGQQVLAPGTVIVSAVAQVADVRRVIEPVLAKNIATTLLHVDLSFDSFKLGGSSFAQVAGQLGNEAPTVKDPGYFKDGFAAIQELISKGLVLAGHDISAGGMITTLLEMCFANVDHGIRVNLSSFREKDLVKILFSENPGVIIQVANLAEARDVLDFHGVGYSVLGSPVAERNLLITGKGPDLVLEIDSLRDTWYKTSYLLDIHQCGQELAKSRYSNYKQQPLQYVFPPSFDGALSSLNLDKLPQQGSRKAKGAIIREKGVNGDREMAYSMFLAGFDVKDVHMTDLMSGRENLDEIDFIVFVGGFSNSDVLGSAKGWAGAFIYNDNARKSLENFYERENTLSLGVCNGCQLMVELGLLYPGAPDTPKMEHNNSRKFESAFVNMEIVSNHSVMLGSLAGSRLGIWVAHGEGKFKLPGQTSSYHVAGVYGYNQYPANPNGSDYNAAAICSLDGRHLAMMPHLERAIFPWQWAHYPGNFSSHQVSPWIQAFVNAREWVEDRK